MITIQSLIDNKGSEHKALKSEHGLSVIVTSGRNKILFDTGSSDSFMYNAHLLNVDLSTLDCVVLSHNHYDHSLGFKMLKESGNPVKRLYTGEHFFDIKYAKNGNVYTYLSCGWGADFIKRYGVDHITVVKKTEIADGIYAVGGFTTDKNNHYETIPERFVKNKNGVFVPDDFIDEVCLVIQKNDGLVMIVGCAHRGIVNMVSYVSALFNAPVNAVYGGVHLNEANEERCMFTLKALSSFGVKVAGFSHCSGDRVESMCNVYALESAHLSSGSIVFI